MNKHIMTKRHCQYAIICLHGQGCRHNMDIQTRILCYNQDIEYELMDEKPLCFEAVLMGVEEWTRNQKQNLSVTFPIVPISNRNPVVSADTPGVLRHISGTAQMVGQA